MPGEEVHKAVLDATLRDVPEVMRLNKEFLDGLYRGVVEPDKVPDEVEVCRGRYKKMRCSKKPAKHHDDNDGVVDELIEYYYLLSLYYYRRNDPYLSGIALGRTLHYIHDSSFVYTGVAEHNVQEERMRKIVTENTSIKDLCKNIDVKSNNMPSDVIETLCIMYRRSVDTLKQFIIDISKTPTRKEIEKKKRRATLKTITLIFLVLTDIALLALLPFFLGSLGSIIFLAFILSMILTFIVFLRYSREMHSLERELARLGMEKPRPTTIIKPAEDEEIEEIKIIPAY